MKNNTARNQRILIVEDDMLLSLVEERLVLKLGYSVAGKAVSGEEAIEKTKNLNPDLILMDISLRGELDGVETMKVIREFSSVPVIYLSGNSDKLSIERAKKTNFVDYLIKPVTENDLNTPIAKAFKLSSDLQLSHAV
ncbi:MAG: response regulator [Balneolaceae bacterium]